jgi:hypothetical protein
MVQYLFVIGCFIIFLMVRKAHRLLRPCDISGKHLYEKTRTQSIDVRKCVYCKRTIAKML